MIVTSGEDRKRTGQQLVLAFDDWKIHALYELRLFCIERKRHGYPEFAFEEFRQVCADQNMLPRHPNAWGALASAAAKEGIIEDTGKYRRAVSRKTHSHPVKVWRSL